MKWIKFLRDRRAWVKAKRTHEFEHADGIRPTISCDAIGHWFTSYGTDMYEQTFTHDQWRKFCFASGRDW